MRILINTLTSGLIISQKDEQLYQHDFIRLAGSPAHCPTRCHMSVNRSGVINTNLKLGCSQRLNDSVQQSSGLLNSSASATEPDKSTFT